MTNYNLIKTSLNEIKAQISDLSKINQGDDLEILGSVMSYIEILQQIPEFNNWLIKEKENWEINKRSPLSPNICNSYFYFINLNNYYRDRIGQKPMEGFGWVYFKELHSFVTSFLTKLEIGPTNDVVSSNIYFDHENGILHLNGASIKIGKRKQNTYAKQLIEYIFKNDLNKKHSFYDIMSDAFKDPENDNLRRCDTAARSLQENIYKETNGKISDFLIIGSGKDGFVKINPKYLSTHQLTSAE